MEPRLDHRPPERNPPSATREARRTSRTRLVGWVSAAALAALLASERVYWYWAGIDLESLGVLTLFYSLPTAVALLALGLARGSSWRSVFAAGALFGLVVEGVITPVVYEDGPLPVLFFLFVWWHGTLAFTGFVFLVRRWALDGRSAVLATASLLTGVYWGVWALISGVVDRVTAEEAALDGGSAEVLTPSSFALYAAWVGVALIVAHVLLDRWWPRPGWRPTRRALVIVGAVATAVAALMVLPIVPWAPVKFVVLAWILWRLLRRDGTADPDAPTVIDAFSGRIRLRHLLPVAIMPTTAAGLYRLLWPLREADALDAVFWVLTAQQVLVGAAVCGWLLWGLRPGQRDACPSSTLMTVPVTASDAGEHR